MDTKLTTRAWNANPQSGPLPGDNLNRSQLRAQEKALGTENLGDYLNRVADPNWMDPSKTRRVGKSQLDKDDFLKLMLAQMKNQDPTNPQKSHEMAAQLAQFTSLEQLFNVNENLKGLHNQQEPSTQFQALNLIGKSVSGDTSKISHSVGDERHDFGFELGRDAKEVKISISNDEGQDVRSFSVTNLKKGENRMSWNGRDSQDNLVPAGNYRFTVEARDDAGKLVEAKTEFSGKITGVTFGKEGTVLLVGDQKIRFTDVKTIVDSTIPKDKNEVKALELDSTSANNVKENVVSTVASSPVLDGVALSNEMMNKLKDVEQVESGNGQ